MADLILHHYPSSPFSEKIRRILGYKGLAWKSVLMPMVAPKPDLQLLTGGYRRAPVLQVGADIYCDTALICDVLEHAQPEPALYPPHAKGAARILAQWADTTLFWTAMAHNTQPQGLADMFAGLPPEAIKAFGRDRAAMSVGMTRLRPTDATAAYRSYLRRLANMLGEQSFLLGQLPCIADFAAYHPLWFTRVRTPSLAGIFEATPAVVEWMDRMAALGEGAMEKCSAAEAIAVAAAATPVPVSPRSRSRTTTAFRSAARSASPPKASAWSRARASWWPPPACTTRCAAATGLRAKSMSISRASVMSCANLHPHQQHDHRLQEQDRRVDRRGLRLRPGMRAHRRPAGHEPGAGRCAAGCARQSGRRVAKRRRRGAGVSGSMCPRPPRSRPWARATLQRFGAPHLVFNNAGVGAGGLVWENSLADWEWVVGVNLMGVAHGIRVFTPMMLEAAAKDPSFRGHIVNTASMAGLVNAPNMGIYNATKHAVVALSETLYQDLALVTDQIGASVLCPFFVATGITRASATGPLRPQPTSPRAASASARP
jgi:glutathione S-transferase/NAD(P)-dependent dehydrogenase (short-subunit alcohol dehydrogenase family)